MKWLERGDQWWMASAARIIDCTELLAVNKERHVKASARIVGINHHGSRNFLAQLRNNEVID